MHLLDLSDVANLWVTVTSRGHLEFDFCSITLMNQIVPIGPSFKC